MTSDGHLAALKEEVSQLRDLFQRRLYEDKAKNRLYEELYEQLAVARGGLTEQLLAPLLRELLLVVDRVDRFDRVDLLTDDEVDILGSVSDELMELMERRGLRRVPASGTFDPAIHEAVRGETVADKPPGIILDVIRPGYFLGRQLLRAEQVVVATAVQSSQVEAPPDSPVRDGVDAEEVG